MRPLSVAATVERAPAPALPLPPSIDEVLLPPPHSAQPAAEGLFGGPTRRALLRGVAAVQAPEGDLDVTALVDVFSAGRPVTELPLEWIETTSGDVQLLLDVGGAMDPFRADVDGLPDELARVVGPERLDLRWFE